MKLQTSHRTATIARARRQTSQEPHRSRRQAVAPPRSAGRLYIPVTNSDTSLLRECAAVLLQPKANMHERGELAGRVVSYLENSRR